MIQYKAILVFIITLNVLGSSFAQRVYKEKPIASDTIVWKDFNEEQYQLKYPSDWTVDLSGKIGTSFIFFSPSSDEADKFSENVNLLIQDLSAFDVTLDQYVKVSEGQVESVITDGKILMSDRKEKNEQEYQRIIYTGKQGEFNLKFEQYYWVIDEKAYVLTLTCEEDEFENYQETGETILNSFVLK